MKSKIMVNMESVLSLGGMLGYEKASFFKNIGPCVEVQIVMPRQFSNHTLWEDCLKQAQEEVFPEYKEWGFWGDCRSFFFPHQDYRQSLLDQVYGVAKRAEAIYRETVQPVSPSLMTRLKSLF